MTLSADPLHVGTNRFGQLGPDVIPVPREDMRAIAESFRSATDESCPSVFVYPEFDRRCEINISKKGGLIIDLDGTLVNSEGSLLESNLAAVETIVRRLTGNVAFALGSQQIEEIIGRCFRRAEKEMRDNLFAYLTEAGLLPDSKTPDSALFALEMSEEKCERIGRIIDAGKIEFLCAAIEFLKAMHKAGVPTVLNTGSDRRVVKRLFDYVKSSGMFPGIFDFLPEDRWVCGNDDICRRGKPAPDSYLEALRILMTLVQERGGSPKDIVALEDRANGVVAAIRAGVGRVLHIPEGLRVTPLIRSLYEKEFRDAAEILVSGTTNVATVYSLDRCVVTFGDERRKIFDMYPQLDDQPDPLDIPKAA